MSAIAREFECTPSAISYILRKAESADAEAGGETEAATDAAEAPARAKPAGRRGVRAVSSEPPAETPEAGTDGTDAAPAPASAAEPAEAAPPAAAAPAPAPAPAPTSSHGTETLRLNRPEPQPVAQATAPQPAPAAPVPAAEPARGTAVRAEPTPPVDAVEGRLRETARGCLSAYRSWRQQPGEGSIQALSEAVHELRKALARIEIDMSASRREEQAIRPIPIPAHRTSRRTP
ncbi:hypothetical protein [Azospirillum sp. SYSU D00513]|uniref:hypothetical protein n=1 Tax=Azospirillum sp. SYSU D00513 TaxID=2812561 RepID=UPI001FFF6A42|nr:hypothetical protein [Azospirillum sp. SYSU D00513]